MSLASNGLKSLNADIAFGVSKEQTVIDKMNTYFGEEISKVEYQYSPYDAESETTKYEIKSRRVRYSQYPTTIIACNKTRTEGRLVFVFPFLDKLCYIVYDKEKFSKYSVANVRAVRSGGIVTETPHVYIPIGDLTEIVCC